MGAKDRNMMRLVAECTSLAMVLPVSTFVGCALGYLLDKAFGTRFLYLVFLALGVVSGFVQLLRQIQKLTSGREQ